ncbi:AfsR/SARP family transcriptional regulator [Saccharothrix coeruleofusca]|uniref:SARP family transcriptional regulator n=1 Tax=Saccharothrix coeruleofusca TaxID=33919 RepID=A0A918AQJ4_9PSEU|nr:BTAD domain-containing putative transcriptional regulator [Saccharothrix coeruleofusca]GGP58281.1 SARP family transcriptional regulator [Saccharothrix coeruleofusca]
MTVEFKVLGPLEVLHDGRVVPVPAGRVRALLAALLLNANRVVTAERLVDLLWAGGKNGDVRAKATLQMTVTRLRRSLGEANVIRTVAGGYTAEVPPHALDLHRFRDLAGQGRFAEALELWRGDPLSDVRSDQLHRDEVVPLLEEHLDVVERRIDADLAAGRSREVVGELRALTKEYPLRERFWAQLMIALHRGDRRAEALTAYEEVRALLAEELGVDPGPRLRQAHEEVIGVLVAPVPRQLPAYPVHFTGRGGELARLDGLSTGAVRIAVLHGAGGIGKTALALYWAHHAAFSDGQLYANLRGFAPTGAPLTPAEVLHGFLGALGVPSERQPVGLDELAALYRTRLADRKVLVMLDNARDADQVLPLLPGGSSCFVLITSRNPMGGLVARQGAAPIAMTPLPDSQAHQLLERVVGADRVARDREAVRRLVGLCGGLPLALTAVAARAVLNPDFELAALADELSAERGRVASLDDDRLGVRAVLSWSYRALSDRAARLFRLLDVHPGAAISAHSTTSLLGGDHAGTRAALAELAGVHLMVEARPGWFTFHDVLRVYATVEARSDSADEQAAARERVLDHYLHSAFAAVMLVHPQRDPCPVPFEPPALGVVVERPADADAAWKWFDQEYQALLGAFDAAVEAGRDLLAWQLCWTLTTVFERRGRWRDWLAMLDSAIAAATRTGHEAAVALLVYNLSHACQRVEDIDGAFAALRRCLMLFEKLGDHAGLGRAHRGLAWMHEISGRPEDALVHGRLSLEHYLAADHQLGVAGARSALSLYHAQLGDYEAALEEGHLALRLNRLIGHAYGEANTLDNIGWAHHVRGDHVEAVRYFQESIELFRKQGASALEIEVLQHLAEAQKAGGDSAAAAATWRRAVELSDGFQHRYAEELRTRLVRLRAGHGETK